MQKFFKFLGSLIGALLVAAWMLWFLGVEEGCNTMHGPVPDDYCLPFGDGLTLSIVDCALAVLAAVVVFAFFVMSSDGPDETPP